MSLTEQRIAIDLHAIVDDEPDSAPPTALLLSRGRRARRNRTLAIVTASCAVLALGVAAVTVLPGQDPAAPTGTVAAESPALRLAAAAEQTAKVSYRVRFSADTVQVDANGKPEGPSEYGPEVAEGAFDPGTATGWLRTAHDRGYYEQRLINGDQYVGITAPGTHGGAGTTGRFKKERGKLEALNFSLNLPNSGLADPAELLRRLRELGSVTETGAHSYRFEIKLPIPTAPPGKGGLSWNPAGFTWSGDVVVGPGNMIEKVSYSAPGTMTGPAPQAGILRTLTIEFSDFGAPVKVDTPTDVVVVVG